MKKLLFILLLSFPFVAIGQEIKVKCDSVIQISGQWAKLSGTNLETNERVFFRFDWMGLRKPSLKGETFIIHSKPIGRRKTIITKVK